MKDIQDFYIYNANLQVVKEVIMYLVDTERETEGQEKAQTKETGRQCGHESAA